MAITVRALNLGFMPLLRGLALGSSPTGMVQFVSQCGYRMKNSCLRLNLRDLKQDALAANSTSHRFMTKAGLATRLKMGLIVRILHF